MAEPTVFPLAPRPYGITDEAKVSIRYVVHPPALMDDLHDAECEAWHCECRACFCSTRSAIGYLKRSLALYGHVESRIEIEKALVELRA